MRTFISLLMFYVIYTWVAEQNLHECVMLCWLALMLYQDYKQDSEAV